MSKPYFQFKRFTVWHDRCAMKVGTDGVLLGAWTSVEGARHLLDVGTGTGLIALMLAQRAAPDARLVALEIDAAAAGQASDNVAHSPWSGRIEVVRADFKHYHSPVKFDVIVSNPPYFTDSLRCPDPRRDAARHNQSLSYGKLLEGVARSLAPNGTFSLVIPADAAETVKSLALAHRLYTVRQTNVFTKPGKPARRSLLAFAFEACPRMADELFVEKEGGGYSPEYIELTKEYYY
ncbi:MAG: methyltransferase [Mediterranea sp.]|jgi:tRNA1Val (adenine37-N6)-methyltransferase|nr:methyltransferase [Mediterranea sp.]